MFVGKMASKDEFGDYIKWDKGSGIEHAYSDVLCCGPKPNPKT